MIESSTDFGSIFSDILSKGYRSTDNHGSTADDSAVESAVSDFIEDIDYEQKYNDLLEEFSLYKKRIENSLEKEKKTMKKEIIRDFVTDFASFLIRVLNGKRQSEGRLSDEDCLIVKRLDDYLSSVGVVKMDDPVGKEFDYNTMEAVCRDDKSGLGEDVVSAVISQGFMIDGDVLIPHKVVVSTK